MGAAHEIGALHVTQTDPETVGRGAARSLGRGATLLVSLTILAVAVAVVFWIDSTEPEAERTVATRQTAMLVQVQRIERGDHVPTIAALGTVEAAQDVVLSPRVSGRIIDVADDFVPGGFVDAGERLLEIDPADYRAVVDQRQSELRQARSDLAIERGRRQVARQEYELLDRTLGDENKALVLREPQLDAARAGVAAAEAALRQAELDLQRTRLVAPFNAQVLARNASLGSQVAPGQDLGRLVGIDEYWVVVTVPVAKLDRIVFPAGGEPGARVRLRNRAAWPKGQVRQGRVRSLIGSLDGETRLARVLVSVADPLARQPQTQGPPLLIGSIVEAEIPGRELEDVVRIERRYLREGERVWVMQAGKLAIRKARVAFKDAHYAYLSAGLDHGDRLVTSNLATVAEGIALRTDADADAGQARGGTAE